MQTTNRLKISGWNCRGIKGSLPYLRSLMDCSDIIELSEHKLYDSELNMMNSIHSEYTSFGKSSSDLTQEKYGHVPGHCGIAILWRTSLLCMVKPVPDLGTDRICVLKVYIQGNVVSVYLPLSKCVISNYQHHLDALHSIIDVCSDNGEIMIIGDWNAHFGSDFGCRAWGQTSNNGKKAANVITQHDLQIIDLSAKCSGPKYT